MTVTTVTTGHQLNTLEFPAISRTTLALFAGASGDHNPIHIDIDFARKAGQPDVFAHGMLSMAYLGRLITEAFPTGKLRSYSVRFLAKTPVHAEVTCSGSVRDIQQDGTDSIVTLELEARLSDGTVTVRGQAIIELIDSEASSVLPASSSAEER
jgi:acyl dehydratase